MWAATRPANSISLFTTVPTELGEPFFISHGGRVPYVARTRLLHRKRRLAERGATRYCGRKIEGDEAEGGSRRGRNGNGTADALGDAGFAALDMTLLDGRAHREPDAPDARELRTSDRNCTRSSRQRHGWISAMERGQNSMVSS